jgi:hypothetical protein
MAMTWDDLVKKEPRLQALLDEARNEPRDEEGYCCNTKWYGYDDQSKGLKARMMRLVGWDRTRDSDEELTSQEAYMIALNTIYDALPGCRHEGTFC